MYEKEEKGYKKPYSKSKNSGKRRSKSTATKKSYAKKGEGNQAKSFSVLSQAGAPISGLNKRLTTALTNDTVLAVQHISMGLSTIVSVNDALAINLYDEAIDAFSAAKGYSTSLEIVTGKHCIIS